MEINNLIIESEKELSSVFARIESNALFNQQKVLSAFRNKRIALRHFSGTNGYGYDDIGRDTLCELFAEVFETESAIVSPLIANGTHAISTALFGLLRPGDTLLSITGNPYDTLMDVVSGENIGSLKDFNVNFNKIDLDNNGKINLITVEDFLKKHNPSVIFIQRSRGYSWRSALSINEIGNAVSII